jgi:hypothetical protein
LCLGEDKEEGEMSRSNVLDVKEMKRSVYNLKWMREWLENSEASIQFMLACRMIINP